MGTKGFFQFGSIINVFVSYIAASFEYLCYGSTTIINIFTPLVQGSTWNVKMWRLQTSDYEVYKSIPAL